MPDTYFDDILFHTVTSFIKLEAGINTWGGWGIHVYLNVKKMNYEF